MKKREYDTLTVFERILLVLKMALLLLFFGVLLTGCASHPSGATLIYQKLPEQLTECQPRPVAPGEGATQRDVADWVIRLDEAYADCRSKLLRVKSLTQR